MIISSNRVNAKCSTLKKQTRAVSRPKTLVRLDFQPFFREKNIFQIVQPFFIDLFCAICFDYYCEPHMTRCGHTFCFDCLVKSLKERPVCPKCSDSLVGDNCYFPNHTVNDIIRRRKAKQNQGWAKNLNVKSLERIDYTEKRIPKQEG